MKAYVAVAMAFAAMLLASSASAQVQQTLCQSFSGQSVSVAGRIDSARVENGVAIYVVDQAVLPCLSPAFTVEDRSGQLRCHKGQRIVASGIVRATDAKASVSANNYTCQ
jgi:hypothetical protein